MINGVRRGSNAAPWFALKVVNTVIFIFILGPILITAAASFNEANQSKFAPGLLAQVVGGRVFG